jgi:hypothetical protein
MTNNGNGADLEKRIDGDEGIFKRIGGKVTGYIKNTYKNTSDVNRAFIVGFLVSAAANYFGTKILPEHTSDPEMIKSYSYYIELVSGSAVTCGMFYKSLRNSGNSVKESIWKLAKLGATGYSP